MAYNMHVLFHPHNHPLKNEDEEIVSMKAHSALFSGASKRLFFFNRYYCTIH